MCPACLMKAAMATQAGTQPAEEPGAARSAHPLPDPARLAAAFPHLEIMELLGQGGMGAVYKARQPSLDRLVALKILPVEAAADPGFAERFNREAKALARLNHPNIVTVYDFGQAGGLHYLVMEYVDGANLRQVQRASKLSTREALQIIPQICEALQFAHDEGVVHRDIKPENVLLDKKGRVKIADFGLAKILGREAQDLTLTGVKDIMGTPHYMAPEQVEHPQDVDHRADIYSLGVVFYELLTGELPLGRFAPPSRKVQVDVRLDEVVLHALEKEPDRRYQQASQVKTDVETITSTPAGAPPIAHAASPAPEVSAAEDAWRQVKGPATGLIITAVLNWISIPVLLLVGLIYVTSDRAAHISGAPFLIPLSAFLLSIVILVAGLKMRRLEAWTLSVVGSVLAILVTPGNLIGLPVGIWALVVLTRAEVRSAFQARCQGHLGAPVRPAPAPGSGSWKVAAVIVGSLLLLAIPVAAIFASILLPAFSRARAVQSVRSAQQPNFVLRGTVTDAATGKPIVSAIVSDNRYGAGPTHPPAITWTDSKGQYQLKTWSEEHTVSASAAGYQPSLKNFTADAYGIPPGERTGSMDFQLQPLPSSATPSSMKAPPSQVLEEPAGPATLHEVPPVVVKTFPESGASGVDPALAELRVTFNAPMKVGQWAWCTWGEGPEYFPEMRGTARYLEDGRTCVLPVTLAPGKVYAVWINTREHVSFQDRSGRPAVPYLLIFETRK